MISVVSNYIINNKIILIKQLSSTYYIQSIAQYLDKILDIPMININYGLKNQYNPNIMLFNENINEIPIIIPYCDFDASYMEIWVDNQQLKTSTNKTFNYKLQTVLFNDLYEQNNNKYTFKFSQLLLYKQTKTYKLGLYRFPNLFKYPYDVSGYKNNLTMINNVSNDYEFTKSGLRYISTKGDWYIGIKFTKYDQLNSILLHNPYLLKQKQIIQNNINYSLGE